MKKVISIGLLAVILLLLLVLGLGLFFLNTLVKKAVETTGPQLARVPVRLQSVALSPLSGSGQLKGLFIGNPDGYKAPSAIQVGEIKITLQPSSVFADTIIVQELHIQAPELTLEGGLKENNLTTILDNLQKASGPAPATNAPASEKRFRVYDLQINDGKVHLLLPTLSSQPIAVSLPQVRLQNIGRDGQGVTAAELSKAITVALLDGVAQSAGSTASEVTRTIGTVETLGKEGKEQLDKATKSLQGITDLFKKK